MVQGLRNAERSRSGGAPIAGPGALPLSRVLPTAYQDIFGDRRGSWWRSSRPEHAGQLRRVHRPLIIFLAPSGSRSPSRVLFKCFGSAACSRPKSSLPLTAVPHRRIWNQGLPASRGITAIGRPVWSSGSVIYFASPGPPRFLARAHLQSLLLSD